MGILANYMMVDDANLDQMVKMDNETLIDTIEELENQNGFPVYSMDKMWDGLHFLLTGASASKPVEENPLSEAIVGVHVFNQDDKNADFIGYIRTDRLPSIIKGLKKVDIDSLKDKFSTIEFRKARIYPEIWLVKESDSLWNELLHEYNALLDFYIQATESGMNIIMSIY